MTGTVAETDITSTAEQTDMSDMTEARVREILDGLEGVTPGPWKPEGYVVFGDWHASGPVATVFRNSDGFPTTRHIARLDPDTVRALCTLALSAIASRQPVVKPLRWTEEGDAGTPFGAYTVRDAEGGADGYQWTFHSYPFGVPDDTIYKHASLAKAAAQADYTQRILSALTKPEDSQ